MVEIRVRRGRPGAFVRERLDRARPPRGMPERPGHPGSAVLHHYIGHLLAHYLSQGGKCFIVAHFGRYPGGSQSHWRLELTTVPKGGHSG